MITWSLNINTLQFQRCFLHLLQIKNAGTSSFFARDNIANFINWCRRELAIHESLMFETDDLVQRKNEKNFILCLLEVNNRSIYSDSIGCFSSKYNGQRCLLLLHYFCSVTVELQGFNYAVLLE